MLNDDLRKHLDQDKDGLLTYEYIANHIGKVDEIMPDLVDNIIAVDHTGQFVVSTARYLHAIDSERYSACIDRLVKCAIDKDRERVYLGALATTLYGADFKQRYHELVDVDDNYRRIYKRLYPSQGL